MVPLWYVLNSVHDFVFLSSSISDPCDAVRAAGVTVTFVPRVCGESKVPSLLGRLLGLLRSGSIECGWCSALLPPCRLVYPRLRVTAERKRKRKKRCIDSPGTWASSVQIIVRSVPRENSGGREFRSDLCRFLSVVMRFDSLYSWNCVAHRFVGVGMVSGGCELLYTRS